MRGQTAQNILNNLAKENSLRIRIALADDYSDVVRMYRRGMLSLDEFLTKLDRLREIHETLPK